MTPAAALRGVAVLLTVLLLGSCTEEVRLTQVVVTVDSNLSVPDQIDRVTIDVTGLVRPAMANADLRLQGLPRTLSLVHDGGAYGPLVVTARGLHGTTLVVERQVEFSFESKRTLSLLVELASACVGVSCMSTQTCIAGSCASRAVGPLPPFDGVIQGGVFTMGPVAGSGGAAGGSDAGTAP